MTGAHEDRWAWLRSQLEDEAAALQHRIDSTRPLLHGPVVKKLEGIGLALDLMDIADAGGQVGAP